MAWACGWTIKLVNNSTYPLMLDYAEGSDWQYIFPTGKLQPNGSWEAHCWHSTSNPFGNHDMYNMLRLEIPGYFNLSYWGIWVFGNNSPSSPTYFRYRTGWTGTNDRGLNTFNPPDLQPFNSNVKIQQSTSGNTAYMTITFTGSDFGSWNGNGDIVVESDVPKQAGEDIMTT